MQLNSLYTTHDMRLSNILQQYDYTFSYGLKLFTIWHTVFWWFRYCFWNFSTRFLRRVLGISKQKNIWHSLTVSILLDSSTNCILLQYILPENWTFHTQDYSFPGVGPIVVEGYAIGSVCLYVCLSLSRITAELELNMHHLPKAMQYRQATCCVQKRLSLNLVSLRNS